MCHHNRFLGCLRQMLFTRRDKTLAQMGDDLALGFRRQVIQPE